MEKQLDRKPREIWDGTAFNSAETIFEIAKRREDQGFDGRNFGDSQNRYADPFVTMAVAACATTRLKLTTSVANPVTRHPAAMAAAVGAVQLASGGRAVLGLSRGDSALAHLGMAPAPITSYEAYCRALKSYLAGRAVPFDLADAAMGGRRVDMRASKELGVGRVVDESRIRWLPGAEPVVPLDLFATGPRAIEIAARLGDRITFAVGAEPARIHWALELARGARRAAGLDPDLVSYGAMFAVGIDEQMDRARRRIAGVVSSMARFSHMHGKPVGPVDEASLAVMREVATRYDMTGHSTSASGQAGMLPDWFVDRFAVVGPASRCAERLEELHALGIDRIHCVFRSGDYQDDADVEAAYAAFSDRVIPVLRRGSRAGSRSGPFHSTAA